MEKDLAMCKMFALICIHDGLVCMNLKAEPQDVLRYIEEYSAVVPGWHMNKKYWVTVLFDGSMDAETVQEMMRRSLSHSHVILLADDDEIMAFANEYAPEHLIIAHRHCNELAEKVEPKKFVVGNHQYKKLYQIV